MKRNDLDALKRCVSLFRRSSPSNEMAVRCMLVEKGFHATGYHCSRLLQQRALGLPSIALTPSEIAKPEKAFIVDLDERDMDRPMMVTLARRMSRLGVSRFSPNPEVDCEAAQARRRELGITPPGAFRRA
jgi:hypothetical protein